MLHELEFWIMTAVQGVISVWLFGVIIRWTGRRKPAELTATGGALRMGKGDKTLAVFGLLLFVGISVGLVGLGLHYWWIYRGHPELLAPWLLWMIIAMGVGSGAFFGYVGWTTRHYYINDRYDLVWTTETVNGPSDLGTLGAFSLTRETLSWQECRHLATHEKLSKFLQAEDGRRVYWSLSLPGWRAFDDVIAERAPWVIVHDDEAEVPLPGR